MGKRTRLGKKVGSVRRPLEGWTYWPEKNWLTGGSGFVVVAPSGARMGWYATEQEAADEAARQNEGA